MSFCPITGYFCSRLVSQLLRLLQKSSSQLWRPLLVSWLIWGTVVIKDTREEGAPHLLLNTPLFSDCRCSEDTHPPRSGQQMSWRQKLCLQSVSDNAAAQKGLWTQNGSVNDHPDSTEFQKSKSTNVYSSCPSKGEYKQWVSKLVWSLAKHARPHLKAKREGRGTCQWALQFCWNLIISASPSVCNPEKNHLGTIRTLWLLLIAGYVTLENISTSYTFGAQNLPNVRKNKEIKNPVCFQLPEIITSDTLVHFHTQLTYVFTDLHHGR